MGSSALDNLRKISNLEVVWNDFWRRTRGKSAPGIDGITPEIFRDGKHWRLRAIHCELGEDYRFDSLRGLALPKKDPTKFRLICVPTVADRIVQRALLAVVESHSHRLGIVNDVSFGFVRDPGGSKRGVHGARQLAVKLRHEALWTFKADISRFFDTIPREPLSEDFCRAFNLKSLSPLMRGVIGCEVVADSDRVKLAISQNQIRVGRGLRQGMPLSPILSNFVLRTFDKAIAAKHQMIRYVDDLVVFATTEAACRDAEKLVTTELAKLDLRLSKEKSYICAPNEAVEFLGMELGPSGDGRYQLVVSSEQMKVIRSTFTKYHDLSLLNTEGLDAPKLFRRLEQMRRGYLSAYGCADNFADLERRLDQWIQGCARKVYGSIFGREAVSRLTAPQRKFRHLYTCLTQVAGWGRIAA